MSQYNVTGHKAFTTASAIAQYLRVKLESDGDIAIAGLTDQGHGVATRAAFAAGETIDVRLNSAPGTTKMVASAAIAAGAIVYSAASGKVGASASTAYPVGIALTAATADNDVIEVMVQIGETAVS